MEILLKSVRIRHGLTIEALSDVSGISQGYISEIERGLSNPTTETLCKLAAALRVLPEELYTCEECRNILKKKE